MRSRTGTRIALACALGALCAMPGAAHAKLAKGLPFVLCNPDIEKSRYFSIQLVDFYMFNYGYMGSRTTGNGAACHMVVGPRWKGKKPAGIAKVFRSETDFSMALIRTQLFGPADLENVEKIQAGYRAQPLSQNKPAPPAAPAVEWPKIDKQLADSDPFAYLDFVLQFAPPIGAAKSELPMRASPRSASWPGSRSRSISSLPIRRRSSRRA